MSEVDVLYVIFKARIRFCPLHGHILVEGREVCRTGGLVKVLQCLSHSSATAKKQVIK